MRLRDVLAFMVVGLATAGLAGACTGDGDDASSSNGVSATFNGPVQWQALARSDSASVTAAPGGSVLRLDDVDPEITIFSDRPARFVGVVGVEEFLALWREGAFASDPPNALAVLEDSVTGVELLGAVWDPTSRSLWLSVRPLERVDGDDATGVDPGISTGTVGHPVQLFIDAFSVPVDGQITDAITQTNVKVIGEAPAIGLGEVYQSMANSVGLARDGTPPPHLYSGAGGATEEKVHALLGLDR